MLWRRRIEPLLRPLFRAWFKATRGLTLGVRGLVVDEQGRVLLIQHTYTPGWHMPGGGVERGETIEEALARELVEEAGVEMVGRPRLLSIHSNHLIFPGDHVLVYRVDHWRAVKATSKGEIHAVEWFAPDALPDEITKGTRRRIEEAFATRASDPHW